MFLAVFLYRQPPALSSSEFHNRSLVNSDHSIAVSKIYHAMTEYIFFAQDLNRHDRKLVALPVN
jgi:hypothetical protein